MKTKAQVLLLSASLLVFLKSFSQAQWDLDKNQEGIKVYTKTTEGSAFRTFKAVAYINAPVDEIIEVLKDVGQYTEWYGYTKTSKLLESNDGIQYNYIETTFPWPYKNRDMVYQMSMNFKHPQKVEICLVGIPDYIPEREGIIRMKKAKGYILLKSMNDKTQITYEFHTEPGGRIPIWLANNSIAELPLKTLIGLRKILETSSQ